MPCGARLPSRAVRERDPETRNCFSGDATWQNRDELIFEGQSEDYAPKLAASYIRWTLRNYDDAMPRPSHHFKFDDTTDKKNLGYHDERMKTNMIARAANGSDTHRAVGSGALELNGDGQFARIHGEELNATLDGNQSVAFWFRANDPEGRQTLFEMGKTQGLAVELDGGTLIATATGDADGNTQTLMASTPGIAPEEWHHVVISVSEGELRVQLDGEDTFACADAGLSFSGFALEGAGGIGGVAGGGIVANGSDTFHGSMDDVRIYTGHALDLDQGRKLQQLRRVEF